MNYSEFVHIRFKDGARIIGDLNFKMTADHSNAAMDRLHAAIGMVGEVRELRDSTGREVKENHGTSNNNPAQRRDGPN